MRTNPLFGKSLAYLIGADDPGQGFEGALTEVPFDWDTPMAKGTSVAYCNLLAEKKLATYGPYLKPSDTARQYKEGMIDPRGIGWNYNLNDQFDRRRNAGFHYIELDNATDYDIADVLRAIETARNFGFEVLAKNPGNMNHDDATAYLKHPSVCGIIVEEGAGGPGVMERLRILAQRSDLPVWFVFYQRPNLARSTGNIIASAGFRGMGVTNSVNGEYDTCEDVRLPVC